MRVIVMGPLKISSQVGAWQGLSCPRSVLRCLASTPQPWGGRDLSASLPLCYFLCLFPFFLSLLAPSFQPSVLKTVPFTARTGKRTSRLLYEASLGEEIPL